LIVVSPSKRAGGTVDSDVDAGRDATNGPEPPSDNGHRADRNGSPAAGIGTNGEPDGTDDSRGSGRTRRRSTLAPGMATVAERGSASVRGVSSSSITKRAVPHGSPPADEVAPGIAGDVLATHDRPSSDGAGKVNVVGSAVHAPLVDPPPAQPEAPLAPPLPLPTARVDPNARRIHDGDRPGTSTTLPVTIPAVAPSERSTGFPGIADRAVPPPEPPYVTTVPHQIAPVPRLLGRRPRVRRVTRVVRHVDPWSVFKVALVFNLVLYAVLLTAGVLLWNVANATGTVDNLERFFESFGWSDFQFDGGAIYHASWIAGLFGVIGLTGAAVLAATLFNLITDLVGGIRLTVLEEEVVERTISPMRRFVVRRPTGAGIDPEAGMRHESDRLPIPQDPVHEPER
jgi:hypothetical protein